MRSAVLFELCSTRHCCTSRDSTPTYSYILRILVTKKRGKNEIKNVKKAKKANKFREVPQQNIVVGNYRLRRRRRAESWEKIPRVSSDVGDI